MPDDEQTAPESPPQSSPPDAQVTPADAETLIGKWKSPDVEAKAMTNDELIRLVERGKGARGG